jgi:hypothetical protein
MAAEHEWESGGVRYKSIKVGSHWYSVRVTEPQVPLPLGAIARWLLSGRWLCRCGRRHRAYIQLCVCGAKAPAFEAAVREVS